MGGRFDVARTRLVHPGPASDEWDHFQRGLVDGFNPKLLHDRPITWLTPKRFAGYTKLSPSDLIPPNLFHVPGIHVDRIAKATALDRINSRELASPAS